MNLLSALKRNYLALLAAPFAKATRPSRSRRPGARLCVEGLEERQVLSTLFLGGQTAGHFNSFADAYRATRTGDIIQIEPGAVVSDPSGTIVLMKGITLQGDPQFAPAPVLSDLEASNLLGAHADGPIVLANLNLGNKDVTDASLAAERDLTIRNSILHNVDWRGLPPEGSLTILNSTLHDVTVLAGPAPYGNVTIQNSTLHDVSAVGLDGTDLTILNSTLHDVASSVHAVTTIGNSTLRRIQSTNDTKLVITGNNVTGAVCVRTAKALMLTSSTFHVDGSAGHCAIAVCSCVNATITDNGIHFNQKDVNAIGLMIGDASGIIFDNTFDTKSAGTGMKVDCDVGVVHLRVEWNSFNANSVGVHVCGFDNALTRNVIDLGGGPLGSAGLNDFSSCRGTDSRFAIVVDSDPGNSSDYVGTVSALHNYWAPRPGWTSIDPRTVIRHSFNVVVDVDLPMARPSDGSGGGSGPGYHQPGTGTVGGHLVAARPLAPPAR